MALVPYNATSYQPPPIWSSLKDHYSNYFNNLISGVNKVSQAVAPYAKRVFSYPYQPDPVMNAIRNEGLRDNEFAKSAFLSLGHRVLSHYNPVAGYLTGPLLNPPSSSSGSHGGYYGSPAHSRPNYGYVSYSSFKRGLPSSRRFKRGYKSYKSRSFRRRPVKMSRSRKHSFNRSFKPVAGSQFMNNPAFAWKMRNILL